ncbi:MAG: TlpA family protein disulfide reductase [Chitinophaga sp.]|uniref:TlpA family protein disulfide reductase n=1 Tax=Chitinophaga sp. TaxID=1869181 RepID=UPI001B1046CF|nr:TlpA disulfide reductase family protein [Chitinophaga sp.]MBO9732849.1 TlpA family protein disulfide reductase [Chitinophaga sp.]
MKLLSVLSVGLLLSATAHAQQLTFTTALHAENEKVTIYREWPTRQLIDTLRLSGGTVTYTLPTGAGVYSVRLRKPFVDAVWLEEGEKVTINVTKDTAVLVNGGALQKKWSDFEKSIKPDEKAWNEWGHKHETASNLDEKLKANAASNRYAEKVNQKRLAFVLSNAGNLAGAWMGYYYAFAWSPDNLEKLVPAFQRQAAAQSTYQLLAEKQKAAAAFNMTGKKAPVFSLPAMNGSHVSLDSLFKQHQYVLLDVWASWCTPCRATNRKLAPLYDKFHKKGIGFVSVSVDEKKELWEKAVAADNIPWTQLLSPHGMNSDFVKQYKVQSLPATFLVDKNGTIIQQHIEVADLEKL